MERGGLGHTESFAPVRIRGGAIGTIAEVEIKAVEDGALIGVPA
jgi:hypothetical protein